MTFTPAFTREMISVLLKSVIFKGDSTSDIIAKISQELLRAYEEIERLNKEKEVK